MGFDIMELLKSVALPIVTGFLGWVYSKYRNKQEREKDILDNVQRIIDIQDEQIKKQEQIQKKSDNLNQRLEAKLDRKNKSIRQANKCPYTTQGDGCPVLAQEEQCEDEGLDKIRSASPKKLSEEEKNEHCYNLDCAKCEHHNPKCDD